VVGGELDSRDEEGEEGERKAPSFSNFFGEIFLVRPSNIVLFMKNVRFVTSVQIY
jgi:hypothetical protein